MIRRWARKLSGAVYSVNESHARHMTWLMTFALACVGASGACRAPIRDLPVEGAAVVPTYLGGRARAPMTRERVDSAPERIWRAVAGRGTLGALAVGERITVLTTVDRFVTALDTRTGRRLWRWRGPGTFATGPITDGTRVYAASEGVGGAVSALALSSGRRRWQTPVGDIAAPLTLDGESVYGVTQPGLAFALRARDGHRRWVRRVGSSRSGVLVAGGRAYLATMADSLVALDTADGQVLSSTPLPATTIAPLALADDSTAILASPAGWLLGLGLPSGRVRWRVKTSAPVFGAPVVAFDTVYALGNDCTLVMVPLDRPAANASRPIADCTTVAAPAILRDDVVVATVGGDIRLADRRTGRTRWSARVGSELRHPPSVHHGQILAAAIIGDVVSFR